MFLKNPQTLQHMLLFGPPGSGKTTSAKWLVDQIWGNRKSLMCISMNAADERSLESIRQKVFPFLHVDWRTTEESAPRFLILDECETLTEAAQLSLQTVLNTDVKDICVILICNSQSRIHPKLRQRLLKIRYDPPNRNHDVTDMFTALTRGDLRQHTKKQEIEHRIWKYIHCHPTEIRVLINDDTIDYQVIAMELLLLADMFGLLDEPFMNRLNMIYQLLSDNTFLFDKMEEQLVHFIMEFKQKFEMKLV
jgi:SpoVK/Ycf46/Vps4 family AAA+-type ATPase